MKEKTEKNYFMKIGLDSKKPKYKNRRKKQSTQRDCED
jgi:hypothetical protein